MEGIENLKKILRLANGKIEILPSKGLTKDDIDIFLAKLSVSQVYGTSLPGKLKSP